ncbi:MAG: tetratricopeptide repeat protein [Theionarchaea archaeon]|nr:tetratricopeptide repeat protein [Theionarchaea archaeon]MBU7041057.1 tetratricopeptide repeat protein [Theionarchaea archaeon]
MTPPGSHEERDVELMVDILDFARRHGRKILKDQVKTVGGERIQTVLQRLLIGEYLERIEKKDIPVFYTLTSRGLNLFEERLPFQQVSEDSRHHIKETLTSAMAELEAKPWEVMFHIIHVVGTSRRATTGDIEAYFRTALPDIKGTSRANIYRNIKHLRMKGYIQYKKRSHIDQNQYRLSKKGEEIFYMTRIDATRKLRTAEEWDNSLKEVLRRVADQQKEDDGSLFYAMEHSIPDGLETSQRIWVLYNQGIIYELKNNLDKAEELYVCMEGICEECEDMRGRAYALKGLGNVSFKKEKYTVAEQYYKRCQRILQTFQDPLLLSDILNNLGSCLYMNDDVDEALTLFSEALTLAGSNISRRASTLYNEGLCYARKEDLDRARTVWEESLALYREMHEPADMKKVEHNIRQIDRKKKGDFLEGAYLRALQTGTSQEIEKRYRELSTFKMEDLMVLDDSPENTE